MNVYDARGRAVALGDSIGHGGEAIVYRITGQPLRLAKIYEPEPRPNYAAKLAHMVDFPPDNPTRDLEHASLAWPDGLLYDNRKRLKGYSMPFIDRAVPMLEVFNPRRRAAVLPQFDRRYLHRTARNLAAALSALHHSGYVAGDLNESNVLVTPSALVTLIDTDSFQVREERGGNIVIYHCPVGKPEYTPPELQGQSLAETTRLADHDSFGLAVLIFQILMEGSHPFRAQWLGAGDAPSVESKIAMGAFPYAAQPLATVAPPKNAPDFDALYPTLSELFRRCFVDGHRAPRWRPGPELWARELAEAEKALVCCAEGHFYSGHLKECPYCNRRRPAEAQARAQGQAGSRRREARPHRSAARPRPAATVAPSPAQPAAQVPPQPASGPTMQPSGRSTARPAPGSATVFSRNPFLWQGRIATAGAPAGGPVTPVRVATGVLRARSFFRPGAVRQWVGQRVRKSVLVGGIQGGLVGLFPGLAVGLWNWSSGAPLNWALLLALGGASAGFMRGWSPGHRLAGLIETYVGWKRFLEVFGLVTGAIIGLTLGLVFIWAVIPVFLGLILGAQAGRFVGQKVWQVGSTLGWEHIWGVFSALMAGLSGWGISRLAAAAGLNYLGAELAVGLMPFAANGSASWALIWAIAGATGSALSGTIAGIATDLVGRLSGLVD